jgi:phosphate transport system protein
MAPGMADFASRTEALKGELVAQGSRVLRLVEQAFEALFDRDAGRARAGIAQDDPIDAADVRIEQNAVALLTDATRQGAELDARSLREVLTIVKVNNELERIADVAVDIAEIVPSLHASQPFPATFRVLANSVIGILRDANASLAKSDPNLGKVVLQSQHAVWAFKAALLKEAEKNVAGGTLNVDFAFHLHEVASLCEMMADHCTNIAEQVIYLTTGAIVRHVESSWVEVPRQS